MLKVMPIQILIQNKTKIKEKTIWFVSVLETKLRARFLLLK